LDFRRVLFRSPINFKIDTGMGRMGVLAEEAVAVFKEVSALPNIKVHSVSTHLPVSNEDEQFTREELHNFGKLIKQLRVEVPGDYKAHALQTAGVLAFAEEPFEIVRPGMLIYGISSLPESQRKSTRLNSSHLVISYAVFCLKKKTGTNTASHRKHSRASR